MPLALRTPRFAHDPIEQQLERVRRATAFISSGRHAAAERLLRDAAGALARRRACAHAADATTALGRLLLERGRARDALDAFTDAAGLADVAGDRTRRAAAGLWRAAALTDAARLAAAESLCRVELAREALPDALRPWGDAVLARVLFWQGRIDEAMPLVLRADDPDCEPEPSAFARATAVRVLVAGGRLFEAGHLARRALTGVEAHPARVQAIAHTAHLRVLVATGDLLLAGESLRRIAALSRAAHAPLRLARARLVWWEALHRAESRQADRERRRLLQVRRVCPPLLQRAIDRCTTGGPDAARDGVARGGGRRATFSSPTLVRMAQREADGHTVLRDVLTWVAGVLHCERLELVSSGAAHGRRCVDVGPGRSIESGDRALASGAPIGPERRGSEVETAVPIRFASELTGAIAARWSQTDAPENAIDILELAGAVCAPVLESVAAAEHATSREATTVPGLIGVSAALEEIRRVVARAAPAPFAVLIEGESGVGKELVARALHQLGPRRTGPFADLNCAALPDDLLDSELFGHARGAFTGAMADRAGLFEQASGGTLFLDEVADLSARAQAKLLRAIQQQEVRRVGETFTRSVDVRIVSAANRDMRAEAAAGRFREDLLYRLDVIRIRVAPLRERPEDIPVLAEHFWRAAAARVGSTATLTRGALSHLARYAWPGNVRELQSVVAALAVAAPARGSVTPELLPAAITGSDGRAGTLADVRTAVERRCVEAALARAGGSRSRAARELGLSRQGLLKAMARLGIA
jgi:DNA-binding NtrC family response regulator